MIQPFLRIAGDRCPSDSSGFNRFCHFLCHFGATRCGILDGVQRLGETVKIMNRFRTHRKADGGRGRFPMSANNDHRTHGRQVLAKGLQGGSGCSRTQRKSRRTVRNE